jgi:hypothetical protein
LEPLFVFEVDFL